MLSKWQSRWSLNWVKAIEVLAQRECPLSSECGRSSLPEMSRKPLSYLLLATIFSVITVFDGPTLFAANDPVLPNAINQPGNSIYEQHCAACHGRNGDGNG